MQLQIFSCVTGSFSGQTESVPLQPQQDIPQLLCLGWGLSLSRLSIRKKEIQTQLCVTQLP